MKTYIGIDNGVTGSIAVITDQISRMYKTPTVLQQSYTKKKQNISRLNVKEFASMVSCPAEYNFNKLAIIERPLVNPRMFKATMSAVRCLEATLTVLESLEIPYMYIDSKEWQRDLLPQGIKGKDELKKASLDIGCRLFPHLKETIIKQKDADGILIAEWARRKGL
jgi:hypothetical protein